VTYAQQAAPANLVNTNGAGLGYVDIYDANGTLIEQLFAGGADGVYERIDLTTP
jgi:hypothetical protein